MVPHKGTVNAGVQALPLTTVRTVLNCQRQNEGFSLFNGANANGRMRVSASVPKTVRSIELKDLPYKGNTVIGNDVWIGYEAIIMPGIQVADGAIIAAKSVVTSNIAPYTIAGGNPAKPIRQRFDAAVIEALLAVAWWNWEIDKITRNLEKIVAADIEALIQCK